jgi:uroporphyrinogen III methyltransferase/synthase
VETVALYETRREELSASALGAVAGADYVTFTSSSTVRFFVEALGGSERMPDSARLVSIGPVTSETARELGLPVHVEASQHDIDGLVAALLADAAAGG